MFVKILIFGTFVLNVTLKNIWNDTGGNFGNCYKDPITDENENYYNGYDFDPVAIAIFIAIAACFVFGGYYICD